MKLYVSLIAVLVMSMACTTGSSSITVPDPVSVDEVGTAQTWGAAENVTPLRHLYFSEQPDANTLKIAAERGITTIVNLRDPEEMSWDEQAAAQSLGLNYVNIPIQKQADGFDADAIAAISTVVREQAGRPVLLHCSSGNRAAGWLAVHLVEDHHMTVDAALSVARKAGLTRESIEKRVRYHVEAE